MTQQERQVTLEDKYTATSGRVYLTGIQAVVRVLIDRARRDREAGLHTGGFVSGYRGSPLSGLDTQLSIARKHVDAARIRFLPGVNEELAATAVWGSQKVGLSGASDVDGVFGLWYGKAPGVDRTGDAFKHANMAGTHRHGGVLAIAGDDHLAKSSTVACQSEFAFMDAEIPVLNPSDLQDVLDFGVHGYELSRFSSLWVAMIALADTMDSSGIVDVDSGRLRVVRPTGERDPRTHAELNNVTLLGNRLVFETTMRELRLPAIKAYVRANGLDRVGFGAKAPIFGFVATGKAYRDLLQAFELLGIDERQARILGIGVWKVAVSWPLEPTGLTDFARACERLMVVEHKRSFMEPQIKEILYHAPDGVHPRVYGKTTPEGAPFLPDVKELTSADLIHAILGFVPELAQDEAMRAVEMRLMEQAAWASGKGTDARRSPYFCSGCPHNTSTKVPEGARALAGIGCHAMAELAGRTTDGLSHMGGEGIHWVGKAPFETDSHVFANLGDGTYFHSGMMAIRQAVASGVNITYKILYNDAVAMTGGQSVDGSLDIPRMTRQLDAEGVQRIVIVSERPERYHSGLALAPGVRIEHRGLLEQVEKELAGTAGVTALIYDQTCAAEKRRRRKKGTYDNPARRLFINDRVCEGCGDCSQQSNCLSVEPLATTFGEKRVINQSSCNKDYSCVKGFCPSFVWVEGVEPAIAPDRVAEVTALADGLIPPAPVGLESTYNLVICGIGGMGVTTTAAVIAMAAHVEGLEALTLDMTGLAQKGGPVTSYVRFAPHGKAINGPTIPVASADVLMASDVIVSANAATLSLMHPTRTASFANADVAPTAEFVRFQTQNFEAAQLCKAIREGSRLARVEDVARLSEKLLGDTLYTNMILVGMAVQEGVLPVSLGALETAVRLNGVNLRRNLAALHLGRALQARPEVLCKLVTPAIDVQALPLDARLVQLSGELAAYQNAAYARRFEERIASIAAVDAGEAHGGKRLTRTCADMLYKLMAIKDEWEVARLYSDPAFARKLEENFGKGGKVSLMLSPPFLPGLDPATGRPKKRKFGPWVLKVLKVLSGLRGLRGSALDPFSRTAERRMERHLLATYEGDLALVAEKLGSAPYGLLCEIARWPDLVRGFGPVKAANAQKALARRETLLKRLLAESADQAAA